MAKRLLSLALALMMLVACFTFTAAATDTVSDKFVSGSYYSFMNADTGRMLTVDGKTEFLLEYVSGQNKYTLSDNNGRYINLQTMSLQNGKYAFDIVLDNDYERYQLVASNGTVLYDSDAGATNAATVAYAAYGTKYIETGWYITKSGDALPKKFVCIGDSNTCGVIPTADNGGSTVKPGYRKELSEMLIKEYGRVVFVGSLKHVKGYNTTAIDNTLITDGFLYRHEGHSGWVIESGHYPNANDADNNRGIADVIDGLAAKYAPDVYFLMIGANDVALMDAYSSNTEEKLNTIASRWETLVRDILSTLPANGLLFGASLAPKTNSAGQWDPTRNPVTERLNAKYAAIVAKINAEGDGRLVTADNYNNIKSVGEGALSSDTAHLSITGRLAMAKSYYDAYNALVPADVLPGDTDGNGKVNAEDAIYLLYSLFFGDEEYPVRCDKNINADEKVNAKDVVYLLYNVFFGDEAYPLYPKDNDEILDDWTGNY